MENKIIKVIYFDESSAMDYICIVDGGSVATQTSTSNESEVNGKLSIGAKIAASLKFLNLFNAESNVETTAELVNQSKDVVKSTITNTILTDFINKANQHESMIVKFPNPKITILNETFTYLKLFTPYTYIISDKSDINNDIAINKLDEVMEKIKGYYEVLGELNGKTIVLRFNINFFRNNYKLIDLLKLDLTFYGVKVGKTNLEKLKCKNEINIDSGIKEFNAEEIVNEAKGITTESKFDDEKEIYDIILAGVECTNE